MQSRWRGSRTDGVDRKHLDSRCTERLCRVPDTITTKYYTSSLPRHTLAPRMSCEHASRMSRFAKPSTRMYVEDMRRTRLRSDFVILDTLDAASAHGGLHVVNELLAVALQLFRRLCENRTMSESGFKLYDIEISNAPLLSGSSAFGSRKRYCNPTMTELRLSTGFQSSRRMFRQTFPSRSTFGW